MESVWEKWNKVICKAFQPQISENKIPRGKNI